MYVTYITFSRTRVIVQYIVLDSSVQQASVWTCFVLSPSPRGASLVS